uniref:Ig-like domain-containing protein n=1 Tax=Moschus moschiferus TaxID=68415 RepID=A0A8C6CLZ5_MOSMO
RYFFSLKPPWSEGLSCRTTPLLLIPGPGGARTSVYPSKAIIPRGGSQRVNCSISCDQKATFGLETELTKKEVDRGNNWKVFELSDVQEDISLLREKMVQSSHGIVWFPEHVELAPLPLWQPVGEDLNLSCQVSGGAPRDHLSVVLLRGEEELGRQPLGKGEPAEVRFTVQPRREDHGTSFSCRWELDLRSQGLELFQNTSAPRKLQTYVLPSTDPHLEAPTVVEVGSRWPVKCMLDGLFPASDAEVYLVLGDQRLETSITYHDYSVLAEAWIEGHEEEEGTKSLKCSVSLGNEIRKTRGSVIICFPALSGTLSPPEVSGWTTVTVECEAHAATVVTLNGAPAGPLGPRAQLQLNASAQDNGRGFSCSAELEVAELVVQKHQTLELRVLCRQLDQRVCLGKWTWQEGSEQTLKCEALGNPIPKLNCSRKGDGASLPIRDLRPVKREVAGTYLCRATSARGEVTREVVVNMLCECWSLGPGRDSELPLQVQGVQSLVGVLRSRMLYGQA